MNKRLREQYRALASMHQKLRECEACISQMQNWSMDRACKARQYQIGKTATPGANGAESGVVESAIMTPSGSAGTQRVLPALMMAGRPVEQEIGKAKPKPVVRKKCADYEDDGEDAAELRENGG